MAKNERKAPSSEFEIVLNPPSLKGFRKSLYTHLRGSTRPPTVFQANSRLVRLRRDGSTIRIEVMDVDMVRTELDRIAKYSRQYDKQKVRTVLIPYDYVRDLMAQPGWPEDCFPPLDEVVTCPVFSGNGELIQNRGYHPGARLWLEADPTLELAQIPETPTQDDIVRAKAVLADELLGDFPFEDQSSRANALAYLLTFFVRRLVQGPIPFGSIDAPSPGTGKGLLIDAITTISLGAPCSKSTQPNDDAEWRKAISAALLEKPQVVVFDNLTGTIRSGALEQLLTSSLWSDRLLGKTERLTMPNMSIWLGTSNNLEVAGDLSRRIVFIRLNAKVERPYERDHEQFRHPKLLAWARENRGSCVWSVLILCQNWIAKGMPTGKYTMGSFQSWVEVLGGILDAAGIDGFLSNLSTQRARTEDETLAWQAFCSEWWKAHGTDPVGVKQLFDIVAADEIFPYVMAAETEGAKRNRLGHRLKKNVGRIFGTYEILFAARDNSSRLQYSLRSTIDEPPPEDPSEYDLYEEGEDSGELELDA